MRGNRSPHLGCDRVVAKLGAASKLSEGDEDAVRGLCATVRTIEAKADIIREGEAPGQVHVMLEGWAARYKVVADGSRQIVAFLIPGDFCDLHVTILREMDHGIVALTPVKIALVSQQLMIDLPIDHPTIGRALWRATLIDEAVLRSWVVNIGRREAFERIAHLFCELHARLTLVGLVNGTHFALPLTQEVLADATGLTPVHVNRMLQKLRTDGLITLKSGELTILDLTALQQIAGFDPYYLSRERLLRH